MKLENQVISLELSKQINTLLKEKGMEVRESFFKWGNLYNNGDLIWDLYVPPEFNKIPHPDNKSS